jgi:quinol monooxygenase YgiN
MCTRISTCVDTSVEKVLGSYTCVVFDAVTEPVYRSRIGMMDQYGDVAAVRAMLKKPQELQERGEE